MSQAMLYNISAGSNSQTVNGQRSMITILLSKQLIFNSNNISDPTGNFSLYLISPGEVLKSQMPLFSSAYGQALLILNVGNIYQDYATPGK